MIRSTLDLLPYQEIIGNYSTSGAPDYRPSIIPYQEIIGNYSHSCQCCSSGNDYTIPRNNRELQHLYQCRNLGPHYTIPRNNRELQHAPKLTLFCPNYTIPRNNRELQRGLCGSPMIGIIPYQEIIGNYSPVFHPWSCSPIIPPF